MSQGPHLSDVWDGFSPLEPKSQVLPRRKEFVVQDLQEELRQARLRIDLLTGERERLVEQIKELEDRLFDQAVYYEDLIVSIKEEEL
jgi:hypothetical protein